MGLGILEDKVLENVPGTAKMENDDDHITEFDPRLKYDTTGPVPILLVPQPSDDPDDPLNWPLWQRDMIVFVLCVIGVIAATMSPILAANTVTLTTVPEFAGSSFTDIALLTGWHLFGVGISGFIFVATGTVWGKRHLFVFGNILLIASCIWGGAAKSYNSMLGARIVQGFAIAPFEALVNASVGDLYHVHQRGKRMAATNLALYGGSFLTPVIIGIMTARMGWQWTFYFVAIFAGVMLPFVILFVPETAFRRAAHFNTDIEKISRPNSESATGSSHELTAVEKNQPSEQDSPNGEPPKMLDTPPERTWYRANFLTAKRMRLFTGRKTDDTLWKLVLRPFPLFLHPAVIWGMITQGTMIGWTVLIGVDIAVVFMTPPLWFTEVETGYTYTGAFIGAVLGFIVSGLLSDWSSKLLAKWNKGIYEPEFRIILVLPQMLVGVTGLYGFGYTASNIFKYGKPAGYVLPSFFFGMEVMGMVLGAVSSALYIVDAHRNIAVEAFTCLLMFKNFFSFVLTWYAYDWIKGGPGTIWTTFKIVGGVQIACCLLSVPMYIFGKRCRSLMHRYDLLKIFKLNG